MIRAEEFVEALVERGYGQVSGVPCSILTPLINCILEEERLDYVAAASEGEAVGLNAGASLAGKNTVSLCQNSGLGNMVNPLTSINRPFQIPTLMIVSWRGEPGTADAAQHEFMGQITPGLLEKLEIPWRRFPAKKSEIGPALAEAESYFQEKNLPFALVLSRGQIEDRDIQNQFSPVAVPGEIYRGEVKSEKRIKRRQAISRVLANLENREVVIGSTGKIGRELYKLEDRQRNLYVVGGLGTASAIGCGLARKRPDLPVVVLDGDGSVLMKMGNLATIGGYGPENFLHVVLDNRCHDSTGGQKTTSGTVDFAAVARACNYRKTYSVVGEEEFGRIFGRALAEGGPQLIEMKIEPGAAPNLPRPDFSPEENKTRLQKAITTSK
ncbi:MAG: phosphonopyruvate decarboxylase [bacterium]